MGDFPSHQSFSKEIAETIGLEEAIIFEQIKSSDIKRASFKQIKKNLTFLSEKKIISSLHKLEKLNLIERSGGFFWLKIIKTRSISQSFAKKNHQSSFLREIIFQAKQLGIKKKTVRDNLEIIKKKISTDRKEGLVRDEILKILIMEQNKLNKAKYLPNKKIPIEKTWNPNVDALSILKSSGVSEEFINNSIPEFILYWREKNFKSDSWNTLFVSHVRKEWAKFTHKINDKNKPQLMTDDWEPDESCYDVLKLSRIKKKFAKQQLTEFRIFWIDSKELMTSWNSKFIQHVKFKWYKKNPNASGIISRLNDKEWAVDIEN